jgi:vacuolar-type H+-ATPase subunit I/STV1
MGKEEEEEEEEEEEQQQQQQQQGLQLLDFDWKLKYTVGSSSMAAINKPLLRLELCMSKSITKQEESELQKDKADNAKSIAIAEYNKTELDKLIAEMEAISQVL